MNGCVCDAVAQDERMLARELDALTAVGKHPHIVSLLDYDAACIVPSRRLAGVVKVCVQPVMPPSRPAEGGRGVCAALAFPSRSRTLANYALAPSLSFPSPSAGARAVCDGSA